MLLTLSSNFKLNLNQIDSTGKIKFTLQVQDEDGIEFLDLKLKLENSKIAVDAFAKPTNSFTYVLPTSRYTRRSLNNIPRGIALRLGRICDTDEKFNSRSIEYKNYLIARDINHLKFIKLFPMFHLYLGNKLGKNLPIGKAR